MTLNFRRSTGVLALLAQCLALAFAAPAYASQAWGSINNFDTVNDTGGECHGFEIELDDIHSRDITYTYDWNHYGVPVITEDNTDPLHPKVFVRYQAKRNPDGTWTAFTAVPSAPISPTQGHQFTNPSVNFGGEHFGVGFLGAPTNIKYSWLKDNGAGSLVFAGAVYISTPTFTYVPPAPAQPAQVVAAIVMPPPPQPPPTEFGPAVWAKEIKTTSHNNRKVELRDLVSEDPNDPNFKNWKNGEPDQVEVEWRIMQTSSKQAGGGVNNQLQAAPEALPNGDEIVTRRYDFYHYIGPKDAETGEAMATAVGPDGLHGVGSVTYADYFDFNIGEWHITTTDLTKVIVVGDYEGAQMAGFDAGAQLGLADHVQDGQLNVAYPERRLVIGGTAPIINTLTGAPPDGMTVDLVTGILSGAPTATGLFTFTLRSQDQAGADVTMTYHLTVTADGNAPPHSTVTLSVAPANAGTVDGANDYPNGTNVTVTATPAPGYSFVNWTEQGAEVSRSTSYQFVIDQNRALVANFVPTGPVTISTSSSPAAGGNTSGGGAFNLGDTATVTATANAGYNFVNWTDATLAVSANPIYAFTVNGNRSLVANFAQITKAAVMSLGATTGQVGKKVTLSAGLKDKATRLPLVGKSVQFALDGANIGAPVLTNSMGKAILSFIVPEEMLPGIHATSASFAGDGPYGPASASSTIGTSKGPVKLTVPTVAGKHGTTVYLTAKILNYSNIPMENETILFSVDGVPVGSAVSGADGVAKLAFAIPAGAVLGYHTTVATFLEDEDHYGATKSGWLNVK